MTPPSELLLFATAALGAAAASLSTFGLRRERHPGWRWWVAALWLGTAGAAALALVPAPWGPALAAPLLLQGPVVTATS